MYPLSSVESSIVAMSIVVVVALGGRYLVVQARQSVPAAYEVTWTLVPLALLAWLLLSATISVHA
jgi:hypothetical protein